MKIQELMKKAIQDMDNDNKKCVWKLEDEDNNIYETGCDHIFCLIESTPAENNFKYCPYCSHEIEVKK